MRIGDARRQRTVRKCRCRCRSSRPDRRRAASRKIERLRRSSFEQPIARAEALVETGHGSRPAMPLGNRRVRRRYRRGFSVPARLGYARHLLEVLQKASTGHSSSPRSRGDVNAEAGTACCFMSAGGPDHAVGPGAPAGPRLAALIGAGHVERNGHHYVDGMGRRPGGRAGRLSRASWRSLRKRWRTGAAGDPRRRNHLFHVLRSVGLGSSVEPDWCGDGVLKSGGEHMLVDGLSINLGDDPEQCGFAEAVDILSKARHHGDCALAGPGGGDRVRRGRAYRPLQPV